MRWINRAIVIAAVLTFSAVAAWAQDQCTEDYLNETYTKWYEPYSHRDTSQEQKDLAYQIAKEYVNKCPSQFPDSPYAKALKSYVQVYEKAKDTGKVATDFDTAVKSKNYADQIRLGKQLVAMPGNADNPAIYILMGAAGLGDANQLGEAAQAAKKAIELVEGGKPFAPYGTKDQALAAMNYVIAKSLVKTPNDAIPYFVKALRYESDLKKSPVVYNELANAYGEGPVDKFAKDYKALADAGKPVDSPEVKLVVANLNQAFDGQIDAFARAAAVATAADKKAIMDVLTAVYKDRFHTDATADQLNTLVASALSKPIPDAPKPITELPAGASTSTSGTTTTGNTSTTPTGNGGNSGAGNSAKPTTTTTTGTTKPAASGSTTPAKPTATPKPRQRANHRG